MGARECSVKDRLKSCGLHPSPSTSKGSGSNAESHPSPFVLPDGPVGKDTDWGLGECVYLAVKE